MDVTQESTSEGLALVHVLSTVLDRLCVANAPMARADPGQVTKFHAMKAPGIGILNYLERIHKYASCSNECFVLALIYIDRLIQKNNFLLTELNVHRVVITAVLLAAKFFDDAYYNNAYYAKVGGVLVSEMNGLEVDFLFRINFSLHVTPEVFEKYSMELLSQAAACVASNIQQLMVPVTATTVAPPQQMQHHAPPPASPVHDHHMSMCNPQAPHNHNYSVPMHTSSDDPYTSSQITPPIQTHLVYDYNGIPCTTTVGQPLNYPMMPTYSDGFTQVRRTHSCPPDHQVYPTTRCCMDPPYSSAPAIITPAMMHYPTGSTMTVMEHSIFPLQNALVHHSHNVYTIQSKPDPRGPPQMLASGAM